MTLEEYQAEYERLFRWRAVWGRLSNKMERGRLESRQEVIEQRAHIANQNIGRLINCFDREQQSQPYEQGILAATKDNGLYRQDILDQFCTPGRTNSQVISSAIQRLEHEGLLSRQYGPCSTHKGPLYMRSSM